MRALNKFGQCGRLVAMNAPNKFGQDGRSIAMKDTSIDQTFNRKVLPYL